MIKDMQNKTQPCRQSLYHPRFTLDLCRSKQNSLTTKITLCTFQIVAICIYLLLQHISFVLFWFVVLPDVARKRILKTSLFMFLWKLVSMMLQYESKLRRMAESVLLVESDLKTYFWHCDFTRKENACKPRQPQHVPC